MAEEFPEHDSASKGLVDRPWWQGIDVGLACVTVGDQVAVDLAIAAANVRLGPPEVGWSGTGPGWRGGCSGSSSATRRS